MPISFVNYAQASSQGSSLVINKPVNTSENDLLIAALAVEVGAETRYISGTPSAYVEVYPGMYNGADQWAFRHYIYYKIATNSEPSSYTFNIYDTGFRYNHGIISCYRGCDRITPIENQVSARDTDWGTTLTAPSISSSNNNNWVLTNMSWRTDGASVSAIPSATTLRSSTFNTYIMLADSNGTVPVGTFEPGIWVMNGGLQGIVSSLVIKALSEIIQQNNIEYGVFRGIGRGILRGTS